MQPVQHKLVRAHRCHDCAQLQRSSAPEAAIEKELLLLQRKKKEAWTLLVPGETAKPCSKLRACYGWRYRCIHWRERHFPTACRFLMSWQ